MTEKSAADRVLELEESYRKGAGSFENIEILRLAPALARQVKALEAENKELQAYIEAMRIDEQE